MKGQLYGDTAYVCEVLDIPISGGYREETHVGDGLTVTRLHSHFITDKDVAYGLGKNHHIYIKGLGFVPVDITKVTPLDNGTFRCDYLAYLKPSS